MPKQTIYNAGIYVRLSKDDERAGESLSIENQKLILTKYVSEQNWNLVDIYVDDGYSGTDFNRPGITRLLDDAKSGKINLIIVKDLSRFGRNYIQVGQYIDYIFPTYNIRFIALNDNVDTFNTNSTAMDMMPIMNVFNEWHAASTSKKLKAVKEANARAGKYRTTFAAYGYDKGSDDNNIPVIDEPAAAVVRRIFEMRSKGISPRHIADILNEEKIPIATDYLYAKMGKPNPKKTSHLWSASRISQMVQNPIYLGHLYLMKTTTVSHKNHKTIYRDEEDMVIIKNSHEPIITQEVWDKCREIEASVSQGKKTKTGYIAPLSGLMFCADCGEKMRLAWSYSKPKDGVCKRKRSYFNCGSHNRYGKFTCSSHHIKSDVINKVVLKDIRSMAQLVVEDEDLARRQFLAHKEKQNFIQRETEQKKYRDNLNRLDELNMLIPSIYEDKVLGKIPEEVCINLFEKYQEEQKRLSAENTELEKKLTLAKQDCEEVDEFIHRLKKYTDVQELTREMCLELIEYVTVDEYAADRPRDIHIYYKLLEKPLPNKMRLDVKNEEKIA